jgi:hypothetical protein
VSLIRYSVLVLGIALATFGLAWAAALREADRPTREAAAFGAALALANTIAAHALVRWSSRRSMKAFLGAVLGGMAGRMAVMITAVVTAVVWLELPRLALVASLLPYFVLYLVVELTVLHRTTGASGGGAGAKPLVGTVKAGR